MKLEFDRCYRAIKSRDPRFDGQFFTAVTSTGIYCRPICPAQTPKQENVRFYVCAAAAEAAGFRACRRCRPDTSPGSPDWNIRADLVARALRLISEGVVDEEGVDGLASRLAVSARHLHRELVAEVGVGTLALARTRRAQTARLLLDQTPLSISEIAFASGFASIRQFNESMQAAFGCSPSALRREPPMGAEGGMLVLRLAARHPFAADDLLRYFAWHAIPGVEEVTDGVYRRTVTLQRSQGIIELEPAADRRALILRARIEDMRDLSLLAARCRQLFDLDADPAAIAATLGSDALLAPLIAARPGLRVAATFDGFEMAVRAIVGQQISVAGACTVLGRLAMRLGQPLAEPRGSLRFLFPTAEAVAEGDLAGLGLTTARADCLRALARVVRSGEVVLDRGADRLQTTGRLLSIRGIGPWTAAYLAMRALGDPDAWPAADLALCRAARQRGFDGGAAALQRRAESWRPWRSYAAQHLWAALADCPPSGTSAR